MRDLVLILYARHTEMDSGDKYGKFHYVSLTQKPFIEKGLVGHQLQIASCYPEFAEALIDSEGLLPCVCDVELDSRMKGTKSHVFGVKLNSVQEKTSGLFPEFLKKFQNLPQPQPGWGNIFVSSVRYGEIRDKKIKYASLQAISLNSPIALAGRSGYEIQFYYCEHPLADCLSSAGHIPCAGHFELQTKLVGGDAAWVANDGELYYKTAGMWSEFLKELKGEKLGSNSNRKPRSSDAEIINLPPVAAAGGKA